MTPQLMRYDEDTNTLTIGHKNVENIHINIEVISNVDGNVSLKDVNGTVTHGIITQETVKKTPTKKENIYIRVFRKYSRLIKRLLDW